MHGGGEARKQGMMDRIPQRHRGWKRRIPQRHPGGKRRLVNFAEFGCAVHAAKNMVTRGEGKRTVRSYRIGTGTSTLAERRGLELSLRDLCVPVLFTGRGISS